MRGKWWRRGVSLSLQFKIWHQRETIRGLNFCTDSGGGGGGDHDDDDDEGGPPKWSDNR